jgi:hypothetical protein
MKLLDEDITKFQSLYREVFGIEIPREDACEKGTALLNLMSIICKKNYGNLWVKQNKNEKY